MIKAVSRAFSLVFLALFCAGLLSNATHLIPTNLNNGIIDAFVWTFYAWGFWLVIGYTARAITAIDDSLAKRDITIG